MSYDHNNEIRDMELGTAKRKQHEEAKLNGATKSYINSIVGENNETRLEDVNDNDKEEIETS